MGILYATGFDDPGDQVVQLFFGEIQAVFHGPTADQLVEFLFGHARSSDGKELVAK